MSYMHVPIYSNMLRVTHDVTRLHLFCSFTLFVSFLLLYLSHSSPIQQPGIIVHFFSYSPSFWLMQLHPHSFIPHTSVSPQLSQLLSCCVPHLCLLSYTYLPHKHACTHTASALSLTNTHCLLFPLHVSQSQFIASSPSTDSLVKVHCVSGAKFDRLPLKNIWRKLFCLLRDLTCMCNCLLETAELF